MKLETLVNGAPLYTAVCVQRTLEPDEKVRVWSLERFQIRSIAWREEERGFSMWQELARWLDLYEIPCS